MVDIKSFNHFLLSQLPKEIVSYLVMGITKIYQDSYDHVFENPSEQARDLLPHYRRAKIESFLTLLPNKFRDVIIDCGTNDSYNSYHVKVNINQLVLTQSFSMYPNEKVRDAIFRNTLSDYNIQEKFIFPGDKIIVEKQNKYYAILKHGAEGREIKRPQFFKLDFPTTNMENIIAPIDVLKLYGISPNILQERIEVIVSDEALNNPPLRTPAKTADEGK